MSVNQNNDFYKVANMVNEWIALRDLPEQWFTKMLAYALKGIRDMSMDHYQDPKTVLLTVNAMRTAVLPDDYVQWTKVGLKIGQYCKVLALNAELHLLQRSETDETVSGLPLYAMPNGTDFSSYAGYDFLNFNGSERIHGIGSGFGGPLPSKGHFNVVRRGDTTNEMIFDYDVNADSQIYVEYISDGLNPSGETIVDKQCAAYVEAWMDLKYEERHNPTRTEASIRRMENNLDWAIIQLRARKSDLSPKTMITLSRREARMTTKL